MKKGNHSNLLMFAADGKLTEEALTACHMTGVEPASLMQKSSHPETGAEKRTESEDRMRQAQINIVTNFIQTKMRASPHSSSK